MAIPIGSIPAIKKTREGVLKSVGKLYPFKRVEAETMAWSEGLKLNESDEVDVYVTSIHDNDHVKIRDVDFGEGGVSAFEANVASRYFGGEMEIRLDSISGDLIGTLQVPYIGDWNNWKMISTKVKEVKGVHDLYFVFKGGEPHVLFNFDWWKFLSK